MTLQRFAAALLIGLAAVVTFSPFPVAAAETRKCLSKVSLIDIGRGKWITSEVRDVQLFLKDLGHYVPDIKESDLTGRIGTRTKAAISSFQKSEGLEATGSIGPLTAERIHQISCGMQVAAPVVATKASTSGVKSPTPRSERAAAPQNDRDDTGPGIDDTTPVRGSAPTITSISSSAGGAPITGIAAWAVTGSTIEVRGTNFNANTRAVIDGDWGAAIAPDRFTAQSFTFEVPSLSLGRHTLRLGDMRNRSSVSNEAHIVIAPPRRVTLYAGGNTGDDVYEVSAGQSVTYELRAAGLEGPDPRASGAYTVTNNGTNCNGPRSGVWNAPSAGTSRTDTVATCQAGTTYRLTYTYSPDGVRTASTHATVKVLAATTTPVSTGPTAQFTANGAQSITVSPGDTIRYRWSSTGATRFVSSYSSDQAACGAASTAKWWADGTASGERTDTVSDCQAGRLYTLTYDVSNTSGQTARSTVTVRVLSLTNSVPTATLTANGATDITVNVGDTVRYAWTSTGGRSYVSNVIADQPSCGSPANTTWWANGTASGERTDTVAECQAGRTYTISYDVITGVQSAHAQVTVRVRSVSQSLPSAAFTANGA
ncbi:MAG TPA: peptidoglycan-binding protein, partial [Candidatus Paceibacterota bacterium]|nr:peptidoglycan-binding protein [Candidatus Paceibacterota bacterium]